jgi:hypothetical protein
MLDLFAALIVNQPPEDLHFVTEVQPLRGGVIMLENCPMPLTADELRARVLKACPQHRKPIILKKGCVYHIGGPGPTIEGLLRKLLREEADEYDKKQSP